MNKFLLALSLGASALTGMPPAYAQTTVPPPPPPGGPMRDRVETRDEALAHANRRFDAIDANHDGKITSAEFAAAPRPMHRPPAPPVTANGAPPPPPPVGGAAPPPPPAPPEEMALRHDLDRNGTVSRDEWRKHALKRFDRVDTNHDGRVDPNERAAHRDMKRMHRMGDKPPVPPADVAPPPQAPQPK